MRDIAKLEIKNVLRNKFIVFLLFALTAFLLGYMSFYFYRVFGYIKNPAFDAPTVVFWISQKCPFIVFLVTLFFSFDYFSLPERCGVSEALKTTHHGTAKPNMIKIGIVVSFSMFLALICTIYNIVVAVLFGVATGKFILNIVLSFLINYIGCSLVAMSIGIFSSSLKKEYQAICLFFSQLYCLARFRKRLPK